MADTGSVVGRVFRGGVWLYLSNIVINVFGFVYWFVISAVAGPGVLGVTSAIVGLASLVAGFASLGVNVGVQRFLGYYLGRSDREGLRRCFWSVFFFSLAVFGCASSILLFLSLFNFHFHGFSSGMVLFSSVIVFLSTNVVFVAFLLSALRTRVIFLANLIGNVLRVLVGVSLVLLGFGWVGSTLGYVMVYLTVFVVGFIYTLRFLGFRFIFDFGVLRGVLVAGLASWVPRVIVLAGQWVGVLAVFGFTGAVETGYYYVAFTIGNIVTFIGASLVQLLLPVLSGMGDGRKRAAGWVLRLALSFMAPVAVFVACYPWLPLSLLGRGYVSASDTLFVLVFASVPIVITTCVINLVYAYGDYLKVLVIGLAQNVPRVVLYYVLTPLYGGLGAALSFTVGGFIGFIVALVVACRVGFVVSLRDLGVIVGVPAVPALVAYFLGLHWLVGGLLIALCMLIGYPRLGVVRRVDLVELSRA
ncbi:MAG: hypothetical protein DRO18_00465, partial [Thermoprotei archaeon]